MAKAIALAHGKPLIAVNHLEAHALTARLTDEVTFPYFLFLASGGHTQIVGVRGVGDYLRLGRRSTTPSARPSTRPPSFSASAIPAGRRSRRRRRAAIRAVSPAAAYDRTPTRISRFPG